MTNPVIAAHAEPNQPAATFAALDAALAKSPGHILFTILLHHPGMRQIQRFYSNMPKEYPVGGAKPIIDSWWMERIIDRGEPYIGRTRDDIREVFFDYELIWSRGCESVLNMPVRWRGKTIGTLNLLHSAGHYEESQLAEVELLAHLALPAMMLVSHI